jgi:hypothetical protein
LVVAVEGAVVRTLVQLALLVVLRHLVAQVLPQSQVQVVQVVQVVAYLVLQVVLLATMALVVLGVPTLIQVTNPQVHLHLHPHMGLVAAGAALRHFMLTMVATVVEPLADFRPQSTSLQQL